jgi:type II secretory pathway pseudopilin PulG
MEGMLVYSKAHTARRARSRLFTCDGFTVLEVTMAAFVLVFAISSALLVMQAGFRAVDLARSTTAVSQVLQSEIETVRLMSWGDVSKMTPDRPVRIARAYDGSLKLPMDLSLTRTVRLVPTPGGEAGATEPDVREITVSASWKTIDGRTQTRSTSTQYGKNGLSDYYASAASH